MGKKQCTTCWGSGTVQRQCIACGGGTISTDYYACVVCHGSGKMDERCSTCGGSGQVDDGVSESSSSSSSYTPSSYRGSSGPGPGDRFLSKQKEAFASYRNNDIDTALKLCNDALEIYKPYLGTTRKDDYYAKFIAQTYNLRGACHDTKGNTDQAIADFETAVNWGNEDVLKNLDRLTGYSEFYKKAQDLINQKNWNGAIEAWNVVIEKKTDEKFVWFAYYSIGVAYFNIDEYDKAIANLEKALSLTPKEKEENLTSTKDFLAESYVGNGNYDKAIEIYTDLIKAGEKYCWYRDRGLAYEEKEEYDKAIADFEKALRLVPQGDEVEAKHIRSSIYLIYQNRGVAYYDDQEYANAVAMLEKALAYSQDEGKEEIKNLKNIISNAKDNAKLGIESKAEIAAANAKLDQKIKTGTATIEELQEGISNLNQGAREKVESLQEQEALKILNSGTTSAVEICKIAYKYWIGDGYGANRILENIPIATKLFTKAAEMGSCMAMRNLGHIYRNQKDYEKALYWYGKAIEQNDSPAMYALAFLYRDGEGVQTDYNKAEELLNQAIKHYTKPDDNDDKDSIEVKFIKGDLKDLAKLSGKKKGLFG
jgi:tetratricopeptide (TPR) repeat protein